jgi:hypothetical protein
MLNNTPQKNTDGSTMASGQQNQFESAHPALLGEKHKVTVKNIQDLQDVEKYMFNNLQSLNKSSPDSIQQSQMIKTRLDELSTTRLGLLSQLKTMYTDQQRQTTDSRGNLADQITVTNVIENEKENAERELIALEQERANKKRLVELGSYEYDRYRSHKNIIKVVTYGSLGVLLFVMLMSQSWFPAPIGVGGICLIIAVVLITIGGRMVTNFSRNNLEWDKFDYVGSVGGGGNSGEKKAFDWGSLFNDTCKNIADGVTTAKGSLLNVKERADAAAQSQVVQSNGTEEFSNIVNPSQPKGHERFHNIF